MRRNNYKRIFGENVKALRVRANLSQEDLAARCGIFRTYLSRVENGSANPSVLVMTALAESLNVHPSILFSTESGLTLEGPAQAETDRGRQSENVKGQDFRFADFLQDIVSCFDRQLRHTYVNFAVELFTGRPAKDFLGKTNRDLGMPAELVDRWETVLRQVFQSGCPSDIQFSFDTPAGSRQFRSHISPHINGSGVVTSVISRAREVDIKFTPDLMAEHYRAIVDSSDDAIVGKTLNGTVVSWNRGAEEMFGYSRTEMVGRSLMGLFPADRHDEEQFILSRLMAGEKVEHFETVRLRKDGQPVQVSVNISPIRNFRGDIVGASKVARNITPLKLEHERLTRVIEGSDQGYWDWNVQTNDLHVSERWETMLGYSPGEMDLSNGRWAQVVHPDDLPPTMDSVERQLRGETPLFEAEMRCQTKGGGWCWILTRGRVVERDSTGKPLMMAGTHTDISQRKKFEQTNRRSMAVFTHSYEGIMVVDAGRLITEVNLAFTRITGYLPEEVVGKSSGVLNSGHQNEQFYARMWDSIHSTGFWSGEIWNRRKNGELYAQMLSISRVADDYGAAEHYVGIFSDISRLKAHEAELDRAAHYDPLTGAANRRLLSDRLAQAIARSTRSATSMAVCYLDLDGFKAVNDQYGHPAGDALLVAIAERFRELLRAEDTLARLGGDEFVLLLEDVGSPEECFLVLERILSAAKTPLEIDGSLICVSASIGVSLYPQDKGDADTLMRHADQAMYAAKESGKNRFQIFDLESDHKAQVHRQLVERLTEALERNEFRMHYQPQVDLFSGEIVGVEALIRWLHPLEGLRSPAEFLPQIQGTMFERRLGLWVIQTALRQMVLWAEQGQDFNVSVNISANQLLFGGFVEDLRQALAECPEIAANHLELEVLESTGIDDFGKAAEVLAQCRSMGVRVALDDFGTGYSSLTYLRKLPIDLLKIDQSFVLGMQTSAEDLGIVEGVVRLASAFNLKVIAEGVETLELGARLLKLGCHLAQGYGIARPMPPEKLAPWEKEWKEQKSWLALHWA